MRSEIQISPAQYNEASWLLLHTAAWIFLNEFEYFHKRAWHTIHDMILTPWRVDETEASGAESGKEINYLTIKTAPVACRAVSP